MNIFVTNFDPLECARTLDDKRVAKMVLETCQILSTAIWNNDGRGWYKETHENHPVVKWASRNYNNYAWTLQLFINLLNEYEFRYKKIHKCKQYVSQAIDYIKYLPNGALTEFCNCSGFDTGNIYEDYQKCLKNKWLNDKRKPRWYGEFRSI